MSGESASDRSLEPTAKRLDDARERGQVPRSADLTTAVVMVVSVLMLWLLGPYVMGGFIDGMRGGLEIGATTWRNPDAMSFALAEVGARTVRGLLPWFAACLLGAMAAPTLIGGWNFSLRALRFDPARLDPLAGLARMGSSRAWIELGKSLLKFAFVAGCAVLVLYRESTALESLARYAIPSAGAAACALIGEAMVLMAAALGAIALIDAPWQLWRHRRELRMTQEEVREEYRESEGSPETKSRLREVQRSIARGRMLEDVPKATVVITNPTHYAVALRYRAGEDAAPLVLAKGAGHLAASIRELAGRHGVELVSVPPLARVLYRKVEVGATIPPRLYAAVAQVLTYVWHVELIRRRGGVQPSLPQINPRIES